MSGRKQPELESTGINCQASSRMLRSRQQACSSSQIPQAPCEGSMPGSTAYRDTMLASTDRLQALHGIGAPSSMHTICMMQTHGGKTTM